MSTYVETKNAAFAAMTPAEKRVEVARDVLAQIRCRTLVPEHGTYYMPSRGGEKCHACGIGSLWRGLATKGVVDEHFDRGELEEYFSHKQINLIEDAFEEFMLAGDAASGLFLGGRRRILRYGGTGEQYLRKGLIGPTTRVRLIMRNIIRNGGCFIPSDPMMAKTVKRLRRAGRDTP